MLAAKTTDADLRKIKYPVLLSPKIDGIRAICYRGVLLSRSMKPIPNLVTQQAFGRPEFEGLDGELVVGQPNDPNLMQQTMSGVMSYEDDYKTKWYVFDRFDSVLGFAGRLPQALGHASNCQHLGLVPVAHQRVESYEELLGWEEQFVTAGYEGVMLRSLTGPYKQGRSTLREGYLLKVKRFTDGEAIVVGLIALQRNQNAAEHDERGYTKRSSAASGQVAIDSLGSITVQDCKTGVQFEIGSGFTQGQRDYFWQHPNSIKGKIVKYKYQNHGVVDKPRMPIFLGIRDGRDMS